MSKARNLADLLSTVARQADLPTSVSELTNDTGFITSASVPTAVSELSNDTGFITATHTGDITITGNINATGDITAYSS
jgi:hypothetical protein